MRIVRLDVPKCPRCQKKHEQLGFLVLRPHLTGLSCWTMTKWTLCPNQGTPVFYGFWAPFKGPRRPPEFK
jgi:hypothetical protein